MDDKLQAPVSELMTDRVICVRTDLPMRAVLMVLVENGISGAPVVDAAGRPVGMVSITDLLREEYDQLGDEEDELPDAAGEPVAGDLMTPSVFFLREDARVVDAVALMAQRAVHRAPVVARDGAVVGIVTSLDVMRWMAAGPAGP